jgi:CRISPR system Cascade subunit CasC
MVTSDTFKDVEASMQVAHAISTNKVSVESDFFTAMDDMLSGSSLDKLGAAILNDVDFNSSCYYIYASIDADALAENLKYAENTEEIVRKAIPALIRAMAFTDPSGKQNSFAGHVMPSVVMVECKEKKIPTSMVNAFVEPVGKGGDLVKLSAEKLAAEVDMTARNFGLEVKERLWFCVDKYDVKPESATKICATFPELVEAVGASL